MLEIIRIHNELMGTYGDRGNADVLLYRAKARRISARVTDISYKEAIPKDGDIYLLGGAEDAAQLLSLQALRKGSVLAKAAHKGATVLAICAGFQLIGESYETRDATHVGLGLLDVKTIPGTKRYVGDIAIKSPLLDQPLTGFENHSSQTILGSDALPLGIVLQGYGNGESGVDGAMSTKKNENIFGTYLHGPILARNPEFADLLLERATRSQLPALDDRLAGQYANWRRSLIK